MPDGQVVCITSEGMLELRCPESDTRETLLQLPKHDVFFGDVAPDGDLMALHVKGEIWFIDVAERKIRRRVPLSEDKPHIVRFSPDARFYATGGGQSPVCLVDLDTDTLLAQAQTIGDTMDLRFSPTGQYLWVVNADPTVRPSFYAFKLCCLTQGPPVITAWKNGGLYASCPFCVMTHEEQHSTPWDATGWPFVVHRFPPQSLGKTVACPGCRNTLRLASTLMRRRPPWWR
jgi:WD40 repeat protein